MSNDSQVTTPLTPGMKVRLHSDDGDAAIAIGRCSELDDYVGTVVGRCAEPFGDYLRVDWPHRRNSHHHFAELVPLADAPSNPEARAEAQPHAVPYGG